MGHEIRTHVLDREETIRRQTPWANWWELWRGLLAFDLIQVEIERIADDAGVEPRGAR